MLNLEEGLNEISRFDNYADGNRSDDELYLSDRMQLDKGSSCRGPGMGFSCYT